jgi:hypothetical protein
MLWPILNSGLPLLEMLPGELHVRTGFAAMSALAILVTTSVVYGQNNQAPPATCKDSTARQETYRPTPQQEA